jgi:hypothetical protein
LFLAVQEAGNLGPGLLQDDAQATPVTAQSDQQAERADHLSGLLWVDQGNA